MIDNNDNKVKNQDDSEGLISMSLGDHLEELRTRLIRAFIGLGAGVIVSLCFGKYLFKWIFIPYEKAMTKAGYGPEDYNIMALKPADKFLVYLKVCLMAGLLLASFWVFYQAWAFVSSGLYRKEKRFVKVAAPASAILFITGAVFFQLVVARLALQFFITFDIGLGDVIAPGAYNLADYVSFMLMLTLVFGLGFQMPIGIVFSERMGLVTVEQLGRSRKIFIVALVFVAAIVTPPDVISQISLAIPLYVLYEGSIIVCRILRKTNSKEKDTTPVA